MRRCWSKNCAAGGLRRDFSGARAPGSAKPEWKPLFTAESLAVVGLVEVIAHLPRIYGEFRKLLRAVRREKPELAILTDSPDFHLRVAKRLLRAGESR